MTSTRSRILTAVFIIAVVQTIGIPWFLLPPYDKQTIMTSSSENNNKMNNHGRKPDGYLNQLPIYLKQQVPFHSTVHCVGETHNEETAWMYRSCEFTNLCLDAQTFQFYLVASPHETHVQQFRVPQSYLSTEFSRLISNTTNSKSNKPKPAMSLALGAINPRWKGRHANRNIRHVQGVEKVQWFPQILTEPPESYYVLDSDVVLVPFHSMAAHNVGHLLWDDFLPIFTLLQMFQLLPQQQHIQTSDPKTLFVLRVDTLKLLYATCEMQPKKKQQCQSNLVKFLPMLGVDPSTFSTVKEMQFRPTTATTNNVTMICAPHAAAGLGMLTDHGMKDHGWLMPPSPEKEQNQAGQQVPEVETGVQNVGKGHLLYSFRNFVLDNLGISTAPLEVSQASFRIVLSAHSSTYGSRYKDFVLQQKILKHAFPTSDVPIVELASLTMKEQVSLMTKTNVFISTCGGGTMTATFLPKGATAILYYDDKAGFDFATETEYKDHPAILDWDLFNNMAYIKTHWLPISTMESEEGLKLLKHLILHDFDVASSGL